MKLTDRNRPITTEDLIRRYNLDGLKDDRKVLKTLDGVLTNTYGDIKRYITEMVKIGSITQYYMSGTPTLTNDPAKDWQDKSVHVGDLYYDRDTGVIYIFTLTDDVYSWEVIEDDTLTEIISIANRDADISSDGKRSIYTVQPTAPYEIGDVWVNGSTIYRCKITEPTGGSFNMQDWIPYQEYTDNLALSNAVKVLNEFKIDVMTNYITSAMMYTTICSFNLMAHGASVPLSGENKIYMTQPTTPYNVGDIFYLNNKIYTCKTARSTGDYVSSDWVLSDYPTTDAEIVGKINGGSSEIKIKADKVNLTGYVTATDLAGSGTTTINGSNIKTGTIDASKVNVTNINASNIKSGTISADKVTGGTLTGTTISGNTITGGTISGSTISGVSGSFNTLTSGGSIRYGDNTQYLELSSSGIDAYGLDESLFSPVIRLYSDSNHFFLINSNDIFGDRSALSSCIYLHDSQGTLHGLFGENINYFKFNFVLDSSNYVSFSTLYGIFAFNVWASDRKLKDNIKESEISGIEEIKKIPHYQYDWKNKDYHNDCGYIAQDMEELNPHYVYKVQQSEDDNDYTYQIDPTNIIPVISKALQEVIYKVEKQQEEIDLLKEEIRLLKEGK